MGLFSDDSASDDLNSQLDSLYGSYRGDIASWRERGEGYLQDALNPLKEAAEVHQTKMSWRDPLKELGAMSGMKAQADAREAKASGAAGMGGAAKMVGTANSMGAAAAGYAGSVNANLKQRGQDANALVGILGQQSQVTAGMNNAILGGQASMTAGMYNMMGEGRAQAAALANQPTWLGGLIGGAVSAYAGSDAFAEGGWSGFFDW